MLLVSFAVHLLLLATRPFGWLQSPPTPPASLSVTLAPVPPKPTPAPAPTTELTESTVTATPPANSPHAPDKSSHKAPAHRVAPPKPVLSRPDAPPATPHLARPARPARPVQDEPDSPAPSNGVHFSAQSLLAQGRSVARTLDGADDATDGNSGSTGARQLLVYGRGASGTEWDSYVDAWLQKIERLGVLNYPEVTPDQQVRLRLTVVIDSSGTLRSVKLLRSSGLAAFDQAALDLVQRASPFAPFPAQLAARASALKFSPHWSVSRDNRFAGG